MFLALKPDNFDSRAPATGVCGNVSGSSHETAGLLGTLSEPLTTLWALSTKSSPALRVIMQCRRTDRERRGLTSL